MNTSRTRTSLSAIAVLAAVLMLGTAAPVHAVTVGGPNAAGACANHGDDPGFGGTHVECDKPLPCGKYAALGIAVAAADKDATVSGDYNCGGTAASCGAPAPTCTGPSPGVTSQTDEGTCGADSDEFWSSTVLVACVVVAGVNDNTDPIAVLCQVYKDFPACHKPGYGPGIRPEYDIGDVENLCRTVAEAKGLWLTDVDYDGLFPAIFGNTANISGLSATAYLQDHADVDGHQAISFLFGDGVCTVSSYTVTFTG